MSCPASKAHWSLPPGTVAAAPLPFPPHPRPSGTFLGSHCGLFPVAITPWTGYRERGPCTSTPRLPGLWDSPSAQCVTCGEEVSACSLPSLPARWGRGAHPRAGENAGEPLRWKVGTALRAQSAAARRLCRNGSPAAAPLATAPAPVGAFLCSWLVSVIPRCLPSRPSSSPVLRSADLYFQGIPHFPPCFALASASEREHPTLDPLRLR